MLQVLNSQLHPYRWLGFLFTFMKVLLPQNANEIQNESTVNQEVPLYDTPSYNVTQYCLGGEKVFKIQSDALQALILFLHSLPTVTFSMPSISRHGQNRGFQARSLDTDDRQILVVLPNLLCTEIVNIFLR